MEQLIAVVINIMCEIHRARREQIRLGRWKALFHRIESGEKRGGGSIPGRGTCMCKGPVAGRSLESLMTLEKVSVIGGERKTDSKTDGRKKGESGGGGGEKKQGKIKASS